jgi:hypothetical protein
MILDPSPTSNAPFWSIGRSSWLTHPSVPLRCEWVVQSFEASPHITHITFVLFVYLGGAAEAQRFVTYLWAPGFLGGAGTGSTHTLFPVLCRRAHPRTPEFFHAPGSGASAARRWGVIYRSAS